MNINNLDCAYVMQEIIHDDIAIKPEHIIQQLIANEDLETLSEMLDYFYQTRPQVEIEPIDNAIRQQVEFKEMEWM